MSLTNALSNACERLIFPNSRAIYVPFDERRVNQVGTGIVFRDEQRRVLVTAKHCLFGHDGGEPPGDKAILIEGFGLRRVADMLSGEVAHSSAFDVAAFEIAGLPAHVGFDRDTLPGRTEQPGHVTVCGYLAKDFIRSLARNELAPRPMLSSNTGVAMNRHYIGMKYEKRRNIDGKTGKRAVAPKPSGLSGGPMLDSAALIEGRAQIAGLLTDKPPDKGIAYGESSPKILATIEEILSRP
jgi:hypothetical protein